ncbi:MAG: 6-phosphofructokinase [Chloroflexi bacterium]|nr:6-phosphofructokinase [Chloroflexota bacterium]
MTEKLRGRLVVGQSGGCTAVINSSLVGVVEEALQHPEIESVYGLVDGVHGLLEERFVDLTYESPGTLSRVRRTPSAALGSCRHKLRNDELQRALDVLRAHDVRYFCYIGGNDSADSSHRLAEAARRTDYDLRVVSVPKTIDNDLPITDHCPGYGSIARFVALATRDAGHDTESMHRVDPVKIVEVMGRNAGWVAAASALGKSDDRDAPHLVWIPERPFDADAFLTTVDATLRRIGYCVVVISETIRYADRTPVASVGHADAFGHPRLVGASNALCGLVEEKLGVKARWDRPGTIQRMSIVAASEVDLEEAYLAGRAAVRAGIGGQSDKMVTLVRQSDEPYRCATGLVDLASIANQERLLPDGYLNAEGTAVSREFVEYARPLLGAPLPNYGRLARFPVEQQLGAVKSGA